MASPSPARCLVCLTKRLKLSSPPAQTIPSLTRSLHQTSQPAEQNTSQTTSKTTPTLPPVDSLTPEQLHNELRQIRLPRAVQATYLTPLRHTPTHGETVCDLQLRSYSVRNLEVFADFCLRAAYYLKLPAKGPIPLPKITERWTVPRANFIFKKSQENFERVTTRRLIQIQDGHPATVQVWLAFVQKYRYYGLGLKANVWENAGLEDVYEVDAVEQQEQDGGEKVEAGGQVESTRRSSGLLRKDLQEELDRSMALLGSLASGGLRRQDFSAMLEKEQFKGSWGGYTAPMVAAQSTRGANRRARLRWVRAPKRIVAARKSDREEGEGEASAKKEGGKEDTDGVSGQKEK